MHQLSTAKVPAAVVQGGCVWGRPWGGGPRLVSLDLEVQKVPVLQHRASSQELGAAPHGAVLAAGADPELAAGVSGQEVRVLPHRAAAPL